MERDESTGTGHSDEEIADTYFRNFELRRDEDFWAWEEVNERMRDPEAGWRMIRILVDRAPSLQALGYVGAGPLEDLLPYSLQFMDMVAAAARDDERLQFALSNVCLDEFEEGDDQSIWERWLAIKKQFDLDVKRAIIYPECYS